MFSKKMMMIAGLIILIAVNIIILSVTSGRYSLFGSGRIVISAVGPFQEAVTYVIRFARDVWKHYFYLVSVSKENDTLRKQLRRTVENHNLCTETAYANIRLRNLLDFQKTVPSKLIAAEIIGKDPSPWIKTAVIDRGRADGVVKGLPVVVPEGIAGQVVEASRRYSKVLMIIDQNSAVDAIVQRNRARGIIKGESTDRFLLKYALRKHKIRPGDTIVSSGLDGVFPKGLLVGRVLSAISKSAGIFQEVTVKPFVDFEKLEEVFVILDHPRHHLADEE
jgi:rod shape-determining protein MreC